MKINIKEQQLIETLHSALHNSNIREFSEIEDFYKNIEYKDLTKLSKSKISKSIKIFKWVVENPDYGFNHIERLQVTIADGDHICSFPKAIGVVKQ